MKNIFLIFKQTYKEFYKERDECKKLIEDIDGDVILYTCKEKAAYDLIKNLSDVYLYCPVEIRTDFLQKTLDFFDNGRAIKLYSRERPGYKTSDWGYGFAERIRDLRKDLDKRRARMKEEYKKGNWEICKSIYNDAKQIIKDFDYKYMTDSNTWHAIEESSKQSIEE